MCKFDDSILTTDTSRICSIENKRTTAAMRTGCRINVKRFKKRIVGKLRSNIEIFRVKKYHDIVVKDV